MGGRWKASSTGDNNNVTEVPPAPGPGAQTPVPSRRPDGLIALRIAAAVIWAMIILALCWTPGTVMRKVEYGSFFRVPNLDKLVHGWIFVILAILWLRVAPSRRMLWTVIAGGSALGIVSELGQMIPFVNRDANLFDFLTDCAGVLIGVAVSPLVEPWLERLECRIFEQRLRRLRQKSPPPSNHNLSRMSLR